MDTQPSILCFSIKGLSIGKYINWICGNMIEPIYVHMDMQKSTDQITKNTIRTR